MLGTTLLAFATLVGLPTVSTGATPTNSVADKLAAKDVGDLSGFYTCRGDDGKGKKYTGVAVITKQNEVYVVQWTLGVGSTFIGLGIRQGDTLAVSWAMAADKGGVVRGINLYRIEPGPRLVGQWATLPGNGFIQYETLTLLKRLDND